MWRLFTPEERKAYRQQFLADNPELEDSLERAIARAGLLEIERKSFPGSEEKRIFSQVSALIERRRRRKLWLSLSASAAAILVICLFTTTLLKLYSGERSMHSSAMAESITPDDSTAKEVQIITGNQRINIVNNADLQITSSARVVVTDTSMTRQEVALDPVSINSLIVPFGRSTTMTLADGTKLWLNAGTRIDFPTRFTGDRREIKLIGEIYLEVAPDPNKPFIVNTDKLSVEVLGTAFNVSAYDWDTTHSVVLVTGNVMVHSSDDTTGLLPGEMAEIANGTIATQAVDVTEHISWTKGVLVFNSTPIPDILTKVGHYYNVSFDVSPDLSINEKSWSGKLLLSESLENVVISISTILSIDYTIENETVYLNKKNERL